MFRLAVVAIVALVAGGVRAAEPFPMHTLEDGRVKLVVAIPDAEKGYYRGTRFDWSGIVTRAEYAGHVFFAPWKDTHDPANHDDLTGTAEEFGMDAPLGYAEAKPGETFIKIGIGHLRKPDDRKYHFAGPYPIVKAAPWRVEKTQRQMTFTQNLSDERGWGYDYTKRLSLLDGEAGFVIERTLKNTGSKPLETTHYGHHFTKIDDEPTGPNYQVVYPFQVKSPTELKARGVAAIAGNRVTFTDPVPPGTSIWMAIGGHATAADNRFSIINTRTGGSLTAIGDMPLLKAAFWCTSTNISVEPFVMISLKPGESKTWRTRYVLGKKE